MILEDDGLFYRLDMSTRCLGQDAHHLGKDPLKGGGRRRKALLSRHQQAQRQCQRFVLREDQRRKLVTRPQSIGSIATSLSLDRDAEI